MQLSSFLVRPVLVNSCVFVSWVFILNCFLSTNKPRARRSLEFFQILRGKSSEFFRVDMMTPTLLRLVLRPWPLLGRGARNFSSPTAYMTTRALLCSVLRPRPFHRGGAVKFSISHGLYIREELEISPSPRNDGLSTTSL